MRSALVLAAAVWTAALASSPAVGQVISQGSGPRALVMDGHRNVFLIDYSAKAATRLPITIDLRTALHMSPDTSRLAVVDGSGIRIYRFEGMQAIQAATVPGEGISGISWSTDGKALSYVREVRISDTEARIEIHLWDAIAGTTVRLL